MSLLKRIVAIPFFIVVLLLSCKKEDSWPTENDMIINEGGSHYTFKGSEIYGSISPARTLITTGFIYTTGLLPSSPVSFGIGFHGAIGQTKGIFVVTDCNFHINNTYYQYANRNSYLTVTRVNDAGTIWEGDFKVEVVDSTFSNAKVITGTFAITN